jgi:hypothetical protein
MPESVPRAHPVLALARHMHAEESPVTGRPRHTPGKSKFLLSPGEERVTAEGLGGVFDGAKFDGLRFALRHLPSRQPTHNYNFRLSTPEPQPIQLIEHSHTTIDPRRTTNARVYVNSNPKSQDIW